MIERVRRVLLRRGATIEVIEDSLQSTALHLLDRREGFDSFDGLVAWVITVAWNEAKMVWRKQARVELGEVPERPDSLDSAAAFQSRIDLTAVLDALTALTDNERHAISSALVDGGECSLTPAAKMRRHRARQRLASLAASGLSSRRAQPSSESRTGVTPLP